MRARRIAAVASAVLLATAALSACGSDDEAKDNTKTEAKALADEAVEYAKKQGSMEASIKGTEDGQEQEGKSCVNISPEGKTESVKGSLTREGHTADVITVGGKQYVTGPAELFIKQAGEDPADYDVAKADAALDGRWMVTEDDEPDDSGDFFDGKTDGITKGEVTEFNGKKVVPLTKKEKDSEKTVYVAAKGDPVVVGVLEVEKDSRTETTVTSMGGKCDAVAPAEDRTLTKAEFNQIFRDAKTN